MTIKRTMVLPLVLALGARGLMVVSQVASATHVRPKGATPLRASLVPAFKQCTGAGNRTHGAPLAFPSCNPPVQSSNSLTVGTPDSNGAAANSIGSILLRVKGTSPEDVLISANITDVRCKAGVAATVCGSANTADGPDYSGEVQGNALIRISDHYNGPGLNEAATVQDIPFPVNSSCANTADTSIGGACSISTSANATVPGSVKDLQRAVVEIQQLQINDGGTDGQVATTADNTLFEVQGNALIRISDHYNGPNLNEAATVQDIPFPVNTTCANSTGTTTGGVCSVNTSANAVLAGSVKDTQRAVVEIQQLQISDGGTDGSVSTPADNTLFEVQGIFIP
jgi:hypothetical protein